MFRDLKEYQEIYNLYQNSVYLSEEQREFVEAINEAELTDEELYYFSENTDEVIDYLIETEVLNEKIKGLFKLGGLVKGLAKTKLPTKGVTLSSIGGFKGFKGSGGLKGISTKLTNPLKKFQSPNLKGLLKGKKDKISKSLKGAKDSAKKNLSKAGVKTPVKTALTAGGVGAIIGGGLESARKSGQNKAQINATQAELAAIKKQLEKLEKERDDRIDKQVDKYVKDRKNPEGINKDLTIDKSKEKETEVKPETKEVKPETKEVKPETKEVKPETKPTETKKKMHPIEKKNRARFGDKHIDKLKAKNKDFQAMKKGKMTKQEFIDKYPKSITAQKAAGLRDHTEWDAYDMVLEYLFSTEQVASLEEANYVMMEMDQQTIGSIVNEVSEFLEEGIGSVRILPALGKMALGAAAVKGISSYLGKKSGESSIKGGQQVKDKAGAGGGGLIKKIKDRTDATNKAIEKM